MNTAMLRAARTIFACAVSTEAKSRPDFLGVSLPAVSLSALKAETAAVPGDGECCRRRP
jgi:hypothetical protein